MISGGIEFNSFTQIRLILEAKLGDSLWIIWVRLAGLSNLKWKIIENINVQVIFSLTL